MLPHDVVRICNAELKLAIENMLEAKTKDKVSEHAEDAQTALEALEHSLKSCLSE